MFQAILEDELEAEEEENDDLSDIEDGCVATTDPDDAAESGEDPDMKAILNDPGSFFSSHVLALNVKEPCFLHFNMPSEQYNSKN